MKTATLYPGTPRYIYKHPPVRGYKEEGAITTAFDIRVQNDWDRSHLVHDVVDRLPDLGSKGAYLKQQRPQIIVIVAEHYARPETTARMRELLALLFLGRRVQIEIPRCTQNDSMAGGNPRNS